MTLEESIIAILLFIISVTSIIWLFLGLGKIIFGFHKKGKANIMGGLRNFTFGYFLFWTGFFIYIADKQEKINYILASLSMLFLYLIISLPILYFSKRIKILPQNKRE